MQKQLTTNQTKTASYVAVGGCGQGFHTCTIILHYPINFNHSARGYLNLLVQELMFFRNITSVIRITLAWKI